MGGADSDIKLGEKQYTINYLSSMDLVNLQNNCELKDFPYKVSGHASVYSPLHEGIISCGGYNPDENSDLSKCILQRKGNDSTYFPSMNSNRTGLTLNYVKNKLYAIGGYNPDYGIGNTMEIIDLNTEGQWTQIDMPFSVRYHCSATLGNNIIVTGGLDDSLKVREPGWNDYRNEDVSKIIQFFGM